MRTLVLSILVCFIALSQPAFAQEKKSEGVKLDDSFYSILEQALNINIAARVSESGEKAIWNVESSEVTIPGRSVSVKLVGSNIVIVAQFTPYVGEGDNLFLVAQGQVWISSPLEDKIKYLTTLKSIPITLGEKVLFFPLGVKNVEQQGKNMYTIELEIKILPGPRQQDSESK